MFEVSEDKNEVRIKINENLKLVYYEGSLTVILKPLDEIEIDFCKDGTKRWFKHNQRHRDDGLPAIEYINGDKEWWIYGKFVR